jgi:hypothetical protein
VFGASSAVEQCERSGTMFWDVALFGSFLSFMNSFSLFALPGRTLRSVRRLLVAACVVPSSPILVHPDEGGARFLRNVGSYKSHTA